jgi:hypothetical protein
MPIFNKCWDLLVFDVRFYHMCAGHEDGSKRASRGDTGGPLMLDGKQVGVIQFPYYSNRKYLIADQTNKFQEWINETIALVETGDRGDDSSVESACSCGTTDVPVGNTCGAWGGQKFNWCYSDNSCSRSQPSKQYPGKHWLSCAQGLVDMAVAMEQALMPPHPAVIDEWWPDVIDEWWPDLKEQREQQQAKENEPMSPVVAGAVGAASMGIFAAAAFVVYRKRSTTKSTSIAAVPDVTSTKVETSNPAYEL